MYLYAYLDDNFIVETYFPVYHFKLIVIT